MTPGCACLSAGDQQTGPGLTGSIQPQGAHCGVSSHKQKLDFLFSFFWHSIFWQDKLENVSMRTVIFETCLCTQSDWIRVFSIVTISLLFKLFIWDYLHLLFDRIPPQVHGEATGRHPAGVSVPTAVRQERQRSHGGPWWWVSVGRRGCSGMKSGLLN